MIQMVVIKQKEQLEEDIKVFVNEIFNHKFLLFLYKMIKNGAKNKFDTKLSEGAIICSKKLELHLSILKIMKKNKIYEIKGKEWDIII